MGPGGERTEQSQCRMTLVTRIVDLNGGKAARNAFGKIVTSGRAREEWSVGGPRSVIDEGAMASLWRLGEVLSIGTEQETPWSSVVEVAAGVMVCPAGSSSVSSLSAHTAGMLGDAAWPRSSLTIGRSTVRGKTRQSAVKQ